MSRFYEVLRQASRSLNDPKDVNGTEDPNYSAVLDEASAPQSVEEAIPSAKEFAADSFDPSLVPEAAAQNNGIGVPIEVVLDRKAKLVSNSPEANVVEHYRLLRTKIMQQRAEQSFRSLLVTSPDPSEGKTITVLNLAMVLAMLPSLKILVVDGDLRKGQLSSCLGISNSPGLGNLLEGKNTVEEVVFKSSEIPFYFMGRGNSKLPAPELLHAAHWSNQVKKLSERFDLVLVDSPPVRLVTDAQLLASGCDAVLLVARAFLSSRDALEKTCSDLQHSRILGIVLNGSASPGNYSRYSSYAEER